MPIAITEDHLALAETAADLLAARGGTQGARDLLTAPAEELPTTWSEMAELGWLGLHLPEAHGGSGFGLEELVILAEAMGATVAPGPFVPTVIASAVVAAAGNEHESARLLPGFSDGSLTGAVALGAAVSFDGSTASGDAGVVLGGGLA